jgi:hypothetical protein
MHQMNLGKVYLGDEAQWPSAIADLPHAFPVGLNPFVNTLRFLCAEEPVEPMEGTKDNAIRQTGGSIFDGSNFRVGRRSDRPIDIRRQIGLAAEAAPPNRSVSALFNGTRFEDYGVSCAGR